MRKSIVRTRIVRGTPYTPVFSCSGEPSATESAMSGQRSELKKQQMALRPLIWRRAARGAQRGRVGRAVRRPRLGSGCRQAVQVPGRRGARASELCGRANDTAGELGLSLGVEALAYLETLLGQGGPQGGPTLPRARGRACAPRTGHSGDASEQSAREEGRVGCGGRWASDAPNECVYAARVTGTWANALHQAAHSRQALRTGAAGASP